VRRTTSSSNLFPAERRAEAASHVVSVGHLHVRGGARGRGTAVQLYPERVDFSALVLGHAITR
jgi:hypothetical protein